MSTQHKCYHSDLDYTGTPRHLFIFMDGTWNDENGLDNDGITTNIYKLFRAVKGVLTEDNIPHQITSDHHIALYFRGIGNDDDNSMLGSRFYGAFGGSEQRIRDHAYVNIVKQYRQGDKICIFGFSRGAATARLLASDLNKNGIVASVKVTYKESENKSTNAVELVYKDHDVIDKQKTPSIPIQFLGLFDTVGAFGIPLDLGFGFQKINLFKDLTLSNNIKKVVHCVSIDETRKPFIPTLCNNAPHVDEVWFAGVHADIGGGYRQSQLSIFPLNYMIKKLKQELGAPTLQRVFKRVHLSKLIDTQENQDYILHYHGDGNLKAQREIKVIEKGEDTRHPVKIHKSVFDLMKSKNVYVSETFDGFDKITAIRYYPKSVNSILHRHDVIE